MKLKLDKDLARLILQCIKSSIRHMESDSRHDDDIAELKPVVYQLEGFVKDRG